MSELENVAHEGNRAGWITNADPLRQALQGAFETTIRAAASGNGNGKRTGSVLPGHDALRTKAGPAMIREDRELLAELARLNTDMASLALRIMDRSASAAEQHDYAQGLIAAGERLRRRAHEMSHPVVEGEVLADVSLDLPARTVELDGRR